MVLELSGWRAQAMLLNGNLHYRQIRGLATDFTALDKGALTDRYRLPTDTDFPAIGKSDGAGAVRVVQNYRSH
jgi:hypothetical protein